MELKEAISKRQSIRRFKEGHIPDEDITEIIEQTVKAPSAKNIQNWYFIAIKNNEIKEKIEEVILNKNESIAKEIEEKDKDAANKFRKFCKNFTIFATKAPVTIIVLSNEYRSSEIDLFEMIDPTATKQKMKDLMYVKNPGMQSLGAALNTFSLAAVDKGYGTCWLTSANYASDEILELLKEEIGFEKKDHFMAAMFALGIPEENQKSPKRLPVSDVLTIVN